MKKTIIALFALCGPLMAGTKVSLTLNASYTTPIIATSELTLEQVTSIISDQNLRSTLIGLTAIGNDDQGNEVQHPWSVASNYWSVSNELHIYTKEAGESVAGNANASFSDADGSWPTAHKLSNTFSLDNAVSGAITLGYAGDHATMDLNGTAVVFSVLYNDGTIKSIYGINAGQKYSNDSIALLTYNSDVLSAPTVTTGTNWTRTSLIQANEAVLVPEPATATLSLLALAGLAARRRRK